MDGIHDMGGMQGFGSVPFAPDEAAFHADWEPRVFAMVIGSTVPAYMNLDYARHALERIPPVRYLSSSYYERWMDGLTMRQIEAGHLTMDEVLSGKAAPGSTVRNDAPPAQYVDAYRAPQYARDIQSPPKFAPGDKVITLNPQTAGHTRLPRYARCKTGEIHLHHGAHVFPDTHAHGKGEQPNHLYTVKFTARQLWGDDASAIDHQFVDIWECHLEAQ